MIHSILEWRKASDGEQTTDRPEDTEVCVESLYLPASSETTDGCPAPETSGDTAPEQEETGGAGQTQRKTHKQPLLGLVLTPTRELAVQVKHHIDAVASFTGQCVLINTYPT